MLISREPMLMSRGGDANMITYSGMRTQVGPVPETSHRSAKGGSIMNILMVDDDPSLVKMISFLLKDEGYEVVTASSGIEALQILQQQWVDMVILDVMLPRGQDGFEICRRVRETNRVPIIMLSARGSTGDRVRGL